jgi:hypothetical protein
VQEPCYKFLACATLPENKGGSITEAGDFDNVPQDGAPDRTFTHNGVSYQRCLKQLVDCEPAFEAGSDLLSKLMRIRPGQHVRGAGLQQSPPRYAILHFHRVHQDKNALTATAAYVSQEGAKLWGHLTTNAYAGYARLILGELFEDHSMLRKHFGKGVLPVSTVLCK